MCLTTIRRWRDKDAAEASLHPNIMSKDMKVYKILRVGIKHRKKTYYSPYRHFPYEKGMHYYQTEDWCTKSIVSDIYGGVYLDIHEGLHAYVNPLFAGELASNEVIIEMIIPQGAKYYLGANGDIVTDQLIWR